MPTPQEFNGGWTFEEGAGASIRCAQVAVMLGDTPEGQYYEESAVEHARLAARYYRKATEGTYFGEPFDCREEV